MPTKGLSARGTGPSYGTLHDDDHINDEKPAPKLGYSTHPIRYCWAELLGCMLATFLCNGVGFTSGYVYDFGIIPTEPPPYRSLQWPDNPLFLSMVIGLVYGCVLQLVPEATLNPAFTLMTALLGASPWKLFLPVVVAQVIGTFLGNLLIYPLVHPSILVISSATHGSPHSLEFTKFFGALIPDAKIANGTAFLASIFATAILVMLAIPLFLPTPGTPPPHPVLRCYAIGITITVLVAACSLTGLGAQVNPLGLLGGYLFMMTAGWSAGPLWAAHSHYYWVALLGPMIGAVVGCLMIRVNVMLMKVHPVHWKHAAVPVMLGRPLAFDASDPAAGPYQEEGTGF